MKKKLILLILVLLLVFSSGTVFAQKYNGVALGLGYTANPYGYRWGGGMITFHVPQSALVFDLYPYVGWGGFGMTLSGDLWLIRDTISGPFAWYLGPGIWIDFGLGYAFGLGIGGRLAVGLQLWPLDRLEIFLEAAPGLGIQILPSIGFAWPVPISLGFRWWF